MIIKLVYNKKRGDSVSCLLRIKETMNEFTSNEKKIADYIIIQFAKLQDLSAQDIAKETQTSNAAIFRFSQKLGYSGFLAMKKELLMEQNIIDTSTTYLPINQQNIRSFIMQVANQNQAQLSDIYQLIEPTVLNEVITLLLSAKRIFLFGVGSSALVCQDFMFNLLRLNMNVFFHEDTRLQLTLINNMTQDDVALAISNSGESKEVFSALKLCQKKNIKTISITQSKTSQLGKASNYVLRMPKHSYELNVGLLNSRLAALCIVDLIYLGIVSQDYDFNQKTLFETKNLLDSIIK